ncbi:DUF563 domain-containing protein [Pedobacter sp. BMA]|uniref:glycosyltransferase family 61 protein n=1 Tax=Pedobacter sp. BMA TaxID=1663685 RepID=UPI00064AEBA4|nr:glycosyltransferase family 61 protein [Pedobacter sp. BMA]KLT66624.1 hypothetical protein AB669_05480 [Pedobacter sp. BMA]
MSKSEIKVNIPLNLKADDSYLFKQYLNYKISPFKISKLIAGFIHPNGNVFNLGLRSIDESVLLIEGRQKPNTNFILKELLNKKFKIDLGSNTKIVAFNDWSENYFHWCCDSLPRLIKILDTLDVKSSTVIIPESFRHLYISDTLALLGFEDIRYIKLNEIIFSGKIVIPSYTAPTGYFNPEIIRSLSKKLREKIKDSLHYQKIYVSREKANKRKVQNENELFTCLEANGFKIICFEDHSFLEQLEIMYHCKYLIGIHGAGLTNMLFMHEKGKVLELRIEKETDLNCYFIMASALNHSYYYLSCKPADDNMTYAHYADVKVDPALFEDTLLNFIS